MTLDEQSNSIFESTYVQVLDNVEVNFQEAEMKWHPSILYPNPWSAIVS